jgi:hypothetical protein
VINFLVWGIPWAIALVCAKVSSAHKKGKVGIDYLLVDEVVEEGGNRRQMVRNRRQAQLALLPEDPDVLLESVLADLFDI